MNPQWRAQVAQGYLLQLASLVLLVAQHFLLPVYLGLADYGRMTFVIGSATLMYFLFDHGYNLLTIRKRSMAARYLSIKLAALAVAALLYAGIAAGSGEVALLAFWPGVVYALTFVLYTHLLYFEIARGAVRSAVVLAVVSGGFLVLVPVAFRMMAIDVLYAPAAANVLTLVVMAGVFSSREGIRTVGRACTILPARRHLLMTAVKQSQLSMGTIMDAAIVWVGVVAITAMDGFESAAAYRIVMSAIGLLTQSIPFPKHVMLRISRESRVASWWKPYALAIAGLGIVQCLLVYWLAERVVVALYPSGAAQIYHGLVLLAPVAALKVLFELATILLDRFGRLHRLPAGVAASFIVGAVVLPFSGAYGGILAFYVALVLLTALSLVRTDSTGGGRCRTAA